MGTILQLNNGFVAVYTVLYYMFISKYWIPINVFGAVLTAVSAIGVYFIPESPKFYISCRKYDEAREAINFIARTNKQKEFHGKFDREVHEEKMNDIRDRTLNASKITTSPDELYRKTTDGDDKGKQQPLIKKSDTAVHHDEHNLTGSLSDLIKIRRHLINLVILIFLWVAASFNLYMISFYMKYVSDNIFASTLTSCLGDIPLSIGGGFLYHHLGPKYAMPIFLSVAIFGSISLATWAAPE